MLSLIFLVDLEFGEDVHEMTINLVDFIVTRVFLVIEILKQRWLMKYAYVSVEWPLLQGVPLTCREYNILTYFFVTTLPSPNQVSVSSLREICDLSCITASFCLVLPGFFFFVDTILQVSCHIFGI